MKINKIYYVQPEKTFVDLNMHILRKCKECLRKPMCLPLNTE